MINHLNYQKVVIDLLQVQKDKIYCDKVVHLLPMGLMRETKSTFMKKILFRDRMQRVLVAQQGEVSSLNVALPFLILVLKLTFQNI